MLILLDIDGVLLPANSWKKPEFLEDGFPAFNSRSAIALQHILSITNASLLLTTSHKTKYDVAQWYQLFKRRGIDVENISKLTTNSLETNRKEEIMQWYNNNQSPSDDFVIIDDDKMLNTLPPYLKEKLILTSSSVGLTNDQAEEAIGILQKTAQSHC